MSAGDTPDDKDAVARAELIMRLRGQNVASARVLSALERTPRSLFLDAPHKSLAYLDRAAPIDCGQTISQPTIVAMMTEALDVADDHRVLEIGTGSGYQAAVLSRLAGEVYSIERHPRLATTAEERLRVLGLSNVHVRVGDGNAGWPEAAPFDRIIVTAASEAVPQALVEQLSPEGVLVAPVGPEYGPQTLMRCTLENGELVGEELGAVAFVPMRSGVGRL